MRARIPAVVIDDDEVDRYLARRTLTRSERIDPVLEFTSGTGFLALLDEPNRFEKGFGSEPTPVLVLLDINMPDMNGFQLLEHIQELSRLDQFDPERAFVVVMLTSSEHFEDREKAMAFDFVRGYIEKPIDQEKLRALLQRHYSGGG